jgi:hypothetical protein
MFTVVTWKRTNKFYSSQEQELGMGENMFVGNCEFRYDVDDDAQSSKKKKEKKFSNNNQHKEIELKTFRGQGLVITTRKNI